MNTIKTKIGIMYFEVEEETDEVKLYDSDKDYINHDSIEMYLNNETKDFDEQLVIEAYKDINTTDGSIAMLGEPVMFADSLNNLFEDYNNYLINNNYDPFEDIEEFKDNIQVNRIGNVYFAIYFNEY